MFNKTETKKALLDFGKFLLHVATTAVFIGSQFCLLDYLLHLLIGIFHRSFGQDGSGYVVISFFLCMPGVCSTFLSSLKIVSKIHWSSSSKMIVKALNYLTGLAISSIMLVLLFMIPLGTDFLLSLISVPPNIIGLTHFLMMIFLISRLFTFGTREKQPKKVEECSPNLKLAE